MINNNNQLNTTKIIPCHKFGKINCNSIRNINSISQITDVRIVRIEIKRIIIIIIIDIKISIIKLKNLSNNNNLTKPNTVIEIKELEDIEVQDKVNKIIKFTITNSMTKIIITIMVAILTLVRLNKTIIIIIKIVTSDNKIMLKTLVNQEVKHMLNY